MQCHGSIAIVDIQRGWRGAGWWLELLGGEGNVNSTPVFLPGEFHGQRSLAGYSPWGRKESDMTEGILYTLTQSY